MLKKYLHTLHCWLQLRADPQASGYLNYVDTERRGETVGIADATNEPERLYESKNLVYT